MVSLASWWASKVRQFRSHVRARVRPDERAGLADWLTPERLALFDSMHVADRRHGAGKGQTGVWPRVAYSLGHAYGPWVWRLASAIPRWRTPLERLAVHAETSASLAESAGCSPRTVELIRHQEAPVDPDAGRALQLADEAN